VSKLFLKRDEKAVRLIAIQADPVVCEIGRLLIVSKQVYASIAREKEGVLS